MHQPLVSVILASYNHASYIGTAIQSVLDQDIDGLELIIIDDGSTDGTPDLADKFRDPGIRLIRLDENRRFHPRNMGLDLARGTYVAFQNSDDSWKKNKLKKQLEVLENNNDISVCYTDVEIIDESGNLRTGTWADNLFTTENRSRSAWLRYFFDFGNCLCISSAVIRRSQFGKVGYFNPGLMQLSDFDLWVRMAAVGDFYIIPDKLTCMRIAGEKNISRPTPPGIRRSGIELLEVLDRFRYQPVFSLLPDVFPDFITRNMKSEIAVLGGLARHAWGLTPIHVLFANQVISHLLRYPDQREQLVSLFGTDIIHQFIYNRGKIDITAIE